MKTKNLYCKVFLAIAGMVLFVSLVLRFEAHALPALGDEILYHNIQFHYSEVQGSNQMLNTAWYTITDGAITMWNTNSIGYDRPLITTLNTYTLVADAWWTTNVATWQADIDFSDKIIAKWRETIIECLEDVRTNSANMDASTVSNLELKVRNKLLE